MRFAAKGCVWLISVALLGGGVLPHARAGFELEFVVGGLDKPLYATHAPGDPDALYIVQQRDGGTAPALNQGTIVRHDLTTGVTTDFLTVPNLDTDSQGGLHALAFHPDYQPGVAGSKLYVVALEPSSTPLISNNTLQEWVLDAGGTPQHSRTLLEFPGLETNDATHAMDWVGFRPNAQGAERDWLYLSVGDGGIQANEIDFVNNPQDLSSLRGKLLRLDVSGTDAYPSDPSRNYGLTPTIYFDDDDLGDGVPGETAAEVYYSGLRNPWRVSFDRETSDIWIGDVGQGGFEEINFVEGGVMGLEVGGVPAQPGDGAAVGIDFGWARREGLVPAPGSNFSGPLDPDGAGIRPDSVDPAYALTRIGDPESMRSITGGYVYRGPQQSEKIQGKYFFGGFDFPSPKVVWAEFDDTGDLQLGVITQELLDSIAGDGRTLDQLSSFAEDAAGNVYLIDFGDECSRCTDETGWTGVLTALGTGEIYRLVYEPEPLENDYNRDEKVDALDYAVWRENFGLQIALPNETVTPGEVTTKDFDAWLRSYGSVWTGGGGFGGPFAPADAVPEPYAGVLVMGLVAAYQGRRSRRRVS